MQFRFVPPASLQWAALLLLASVPGSPAAGQVQLAFEFSYSNPGARSLGFGGAFVALADDATAAFANPAGLTQLVEPEVSVEGRHLSYSTPFARSGRGSGEPTGLGIDTERGIVLGSSEEDLTELSFLSFVYPRKRWSVALYRHLPASFEFAVDTQGLFGDAATTEGPVSYAGTVRLADQRGASQLEIVTHGVAGAWRVGEDLSLGIGLSYYQGTHDLRSDQYLWDDDTLEGFFAESSFLPERRWMDASLITDGSDWALTASFLWRLSGRWNAGGFFRQGPELDGELATLVGPTFPELAGTLIRVPAPIAFPDVYGLGIAFRSAGGRWTLSGEWDRVEYSSIFGSIRKISDRDPRFSFPEAIPDGDELRFGAEYVIVASTPLLAVRLGVWLDPDHRVRSLSDDPFVRAIHPPGSDELHAAVGFGARFERFQVDVGADFSGQRDTASISAIFSF